MVRLLMVETWFRDPASWVKLTLFSWSLIITFCIWICIWLGVYATDGVLLELSWQWRYVWVWLPWPWFWFYVVALKRKVTWNTIIATSVIFPGPLVVRQIKGSIETFSKLQLFDWLNWYFIDKIEIRHIVQGPKLLSALLAKLLMIQFK